MPAVSPICRSHTLQTSQAPAMCAPVCLSDVAASHLWPVSHCHRQSRHDNSCVVLIRSKRRQLMTHSQTPGVMLIIITHLTPPQALYKQTWNSKTKQPSCSAKKKSSFQPHHHHHICCTSCLLQSDPPQKNPKSHLTPPTVIVFNPTIIITAAVPRACCRVTSMLLSTLTRLSDANKERVVDMLASYGTGDLHRCVLSHSHSPYVV